MYNAVRIDRKLGKLCRWSDCAVYRAASLIAQKYWKYSCTGSKPGYTRQAIHMPLQSQRCTRKRLPP
jgi:hypothetical protein